MNKNLKDEYIKMPESFHKAVTETLDAVGEPKEKTVHFNHGFRTAVVIAAVVIVMNITVFATNETVREAVKNWFRKSAPYQVELLSDDEEIKPAPENIELKLNYLPKGMVQSPDPAMYHFESDNNWMGGMSFAVFRASDIKGGKVNNVVSSEEFTANGHRALILEYPSLGDVELYNGKGTYAVRDLIVFYDDMGCVVRCWAGKDVSDRELKKIADGIEITETTAENSFGYETNLNFFMIANTNEEYASGPDEQYQSVKTVNEIKNVKDIRSGAVFDVGFGKVNVTENISGFNKDSFNTCEISAEPVITDDNGNFLEHNRITYEYGDGVNSVTTVRESVTVGRKMVYFDITVKNTSDSDGEYYIGQLFNKMGTFGDIRDYPHLLGGHSLANYVGGNDKDSGSYYFVPVKSGETKTVTVGWIADSDADTDNIFYVGYDTDGQYYALPLS